MQLQLPTPAIQGCPSCTWMRCRAQPCSRLFGSLPRRWHPWLAQPGSPLGAGCSGCLCSPGTLQPATPALNSPSQARASLPRRMLPHSSQAGSCLLPGASRARVPPFAPAPCASWGSDAPIHPTLPYSPALHHAVIPPSPHGAAAGHRPKDAQHPTVSGCCGSPRAAGSAPSQRLCQGAAGEPRGEPGSRGASSGAMLQKPPCQNPAQIRRGKRY